MRPSEVWAAERSKREFLATLGNLGNWLQTSITEITNFEPQEIEELTFAVNFGPRTSNPDVAVVVRLTTEQPTSERGSADSRPHPRRRASWSARRESRRSRLGGFKIGNDKLAGR